MKIPAVQKAFILLSCTFLGLICGTLYLYSSYSPQFARQLNYSVTDASRIALLGTVGVAVAGPIAGMFVDKKGYTIALAIGGLSIVSGYLGMKTQFDKEYSNLVLSSTLVFLIGWGSTFINSACMKCCAVSFPNIRGVATSLPLALYGLSAMFYSVIASIFYPGDTSNFLGFLAYSSIGILCVCAPSVIWCDRQHKLRKSVILDHKPELIELKTLGPRPPPKLATSRKQTHAYDPSGTMHENITGSQLMYEPRFWLLFLTTGLLAAIGQMYIYSVGYMVKALITSHLSTSEISTQAIEEIIQKEQQMQVSLLSIANCIGRILAGILGDIILQSFNKPRTLLLFIPGFGFMLSQMLLLVLADYTKLPLVSLLIGLVYGFIFCIIPIIVGDTFGMESFSFNWGIVALAPIVPSFYFTSLFGKIYDSNSTIDPVSNALSCTLGKLCYSSIFKFTFCVTIIVTVIIVVLNFGRRYLIRHATDLKV